MSLSTAYVQAQVVFEANASAKQVLLDNYFEVSFKLKNANGTQFAPPTFKDFIILAGPSTSSSVQIINGAVSKEMSYTYTLQATKLGKLTIGSASIKANGKILKTQAIPIEVVKGNKRPQGKYNDYFISVQPSKLQCYIGEQILLDFKLYTKVGIEGYDLPEDSDYDGFYAVELRRFHSNTVQEVLNGQQYTTKILRRIALFPQRTGELTIDPFRIQLAIIEQGGDGGGFFFSRNVKPVFFTTDAIKIKVNPIPKNEPQGFCGAIGDYELEAGVDRKSATTDDALALTLKIRGNGDAKRIQPPILSFSDSIEVYEPKLKEEKTDEYQGEVLSEKTFEYLLLPKYAGDYQIRPKISFFNATTNRFEQFNTGILNVTVKKGAGKAKSNSLPNRKSANDILPILVGTQLDRTPNLIFITILVLLFTLPTLLTLIFYLRKRKQVSLENIDPGLLKATMARQEAQKRLSLANQRIQQGDIKGFYEALAKSFLGYIADKLAMPSSQLSKDNVREKLVTLGINPITIEEFLRILQQCETAIYAGSISDEIVQSTYEKAVQTISSLDAELTQKIK